MTLAAVGGYPPRRSSRPFSPAAKSSSASLLISLDLDSPSVPSYHATTQTSAVFLLTLLELSPPSLRRYIDPPLPLPSRYETTGTQMDLESLLFLCKDVLATVCPKLLETKSWERLVHNVLLSCDGSDDSDYDDDIPIFQSEWEKQWEYSDEEDDPLDAVSNIVLEGRGRQGYSSSSHWETIDRRGQMVLSPEFDDVVKVGDRDPDAEETWHDASDRIGCMDLVSRVCEMIAEWEDDGDSLIPTALSDDKSAQGLYRKQASKTHPLTLDCTGVHRLRRVSVGSKAIDSAFSLWAAEYIEPDFDLPDLPPYPPGMYSPVSPVSPASQWQWADDRSPSRGRKRS